MKAGVKGLGALGAAALLIAAVAALPAGASSGGAGASKSACSLSGGEQRDLGASYVYSLKVRNLSCEKGKKLVVKFHDCRHDNGGRRGHCNSVKGYSCNEKKQDSSPTLYQAKAKCKKGSKKFAQTFGELI